ncbi:hypothetical protein NML43_07530 [Rhodopseudomonas palustris]|uniref:hypothetical protein n=1 Tax=Rhodopseudomonas palustris TaxID=1076 RepID=UPI0020CE60F6|nr:hypothetical protein [Rhodopseudomonas palustris]MCP9626932.1 hypothetical protein [Rhodopseudomonas palustris]
MLNELWKLIAEFIRGSYKNAFYRSLSLGIIFSIVMTLIIGSIEKVFVLSKDPPYFTVVDQVYWVGIVFVSFAILFAFLGYLSELNARDDLLTPLRKQLIGVWDVRSESWTIQDSRIEFGWVKSTCTIGIEPLGGKLLIRFDVRNSDIFRDTKIDVTTTAFSFDGVRRKLIYFYEAELDLLEPIGMPPDQVSKVGFPFLGVLQLNFDNEKINSMTGYWYDINNSVFNLARRIDALTGFDELSLAVEKGAVTFGGRLEFSRVEPPPGMH